MKRSNFNEPKIHFKFSYAKGFIKPNHKLFFIAWQGFPWLTTGG